jgi:hypothetical protein
MVVQRKEMQKSLDHCFKLLLTPSSRLEILRPFALALSSSDEDVCKTQPQGLHSPNMDTSNYSDLLELISRVGETSSEVHQRQMRLILRPDVSAKRLESPQVIVQKPAERQRV